MKDEKRKDVALARFGVVKAMEARKNEFSSEKELYIYGTSLPYVIDGEEHPPVSWFTIRRWYKSYKEDGFDALMPVKRSDDGRSRKLDDDLKDRITILVKEHPMAPAAVIYRKMIEDKVFGSDEISLTTVTRYVAKIKDITVEKVIEDKRRYEHESRNAVWYGDTLYGPKIKIGEVWKKTFFIFIVDDASRLVTGFGIFLHDDTPSLMTVMSQAFGNYGLPKLLVFDNGSNYKSKNTKLFAARLGVNIHYNKPYEPTQKAKIERFNKTVRDQFISMLVEDDLKSLDSLRQALSLYIRKFNSSKHSSLGESPNDRFFNDSAKITRVSPETLENATWMEEKREVSVDRVLQLNNVQYEAPVWFSGKKVWIRYKPDYSKVWILDDNEKLIEILPLDKHENAHNARICMSTRGKNPDSEGEDS